MRCPVTYPAASLHRNATTFAMRRGRYCPSKHVTWPLAAAYESLLPDLWKRCHPEAIRQYSQEERRDKADRKQYNAARRRKPPCASSNPSSDCW